MKNHFKEYLTSQAYFTDVELQKILTGLRLIFVKKGEDLYTEGTSWQYDGIVCSGLLYKHTTNSVGAKKVTAFSSENYWVGDRRSWITGTVMPHTATALEDTHVALLPTAEIDKLRVAIPTLNELFEQLVQKNLDVTQKMVMKSAILTDEEKYTEFITKRPGLHKRIPQEYIASYLDIQPKNMALIIDGLPWIASGTKTT